MNTGRSQSSHTVKDPRCRRWDAKTTRLKISKTARGQQIAPGIKSGFNWCNLQRSFLYRHMPIWPITWKSVAKMTIPKGIPPAFVLLCHTATSLGWICSTPHTECRYVWIKNHAILLYPLRNSTAKTSLCETARVVPSLGGSWFAGRADHLPPDEACQKFTNQELTCWSKVHVPPFHHSTVPRKS